MVSDAAKRKSPRGARKAGPLVPLSRGKIVKTALALVDREGMAALSMRRLGAELGVDPMAVYHHLPNKEALLDAIVEAVMSEMELDLDDQEKCAEDRVFMAAAVYRNAMLAHPHALPIVLSRGPVTPASLRPVELLVGILREAGLPPAQAMAGMNIIAAAVRGMVCMTQDKTDFMHESCEMLEKTFPANAFPHLRECAFNTESMEDSGFEFGIRAIARGLLAHKRS